VKRFALLSIGVIALAASMLAQGPPSDGFYPVWPPLGSEYTPVAPPDVARGPVPRMPDGKPDLHGPWVGGGSNDDIEREGGLKPGSCRSCRGQSLFATAARKTTSRTCTARR
jgi:hypothetical protein